jgi:hypothetical protein
MNKLKPAILGGLLVGFLSAIPFVNIGNACCCLWALLGGALASLLYIKASPSRVTAGDGAILGVLAGVIGAAIYIVVGIPLNIFLGPTIIRLINGLVWAALNPQQRMLMRQMQAGQTVIAIILKGLIWAILLVVFSTIGGLLGVPIFEKRKGGADAPPPQNFGGGYGAAA